MQAACPDGADLDQTKFDSYNGPAMIRAAIGDGVEARRVGHGIEALKDAALVEELAGRSVPRGGRPHGVCLEVCPVSNRRLGYVPGGLKTHPLAELCRRGVSCALSADDPSFFGSRTSHGLNREFISARHLGGMDDASLAAMAYNSIDFSSMPEEDAKAKAKEAIAEWLSSRS